LQKIRCNKSHAGCCDRARCGVVVTLSPFVA
jgi:hypothetical protein